MLSSSTLRKAILLRQAREEHGTTLVLMSLLLVTLMGMSALVLDLGNARRVKRGAQGTSDSASLAAAQELGKADITAAQRVINAVAEARTYAERNLPAPDGGWAAAWTACSDPSHLAYVPSSGTGNCISFDDADIPTKVRVKVPTQQVQAQFAGAIGQGAPVAVSASATAGIASPQSAFQGRLVLPIAHGPDTDTPWTRRRFRLRRSSPPPAGRILIYDDSNLNAWDRSCRKIDSSSNAACVFQSPRLANLFPFDEAALTGPDALRVNMAMGLDHDLGTYPPGAPLGGPPTRVCDGPTATSPATYPCSTTNVASGTVANHVIMAQGRRWNWVFSLLCLLGCWKSEDLPSMDAWRGAVDAGLAMGTLPSSNSPGYFRIGPTDTEFCARLARPALTEGNYNLGRPGGTCAPDAPTTQLQVNCGAFCTRTRTINGRHVGSYLTAAAKTHFFGAPGGPLGSGCNVNPANPDNNNDDPNDDNNVDHDSWNDYIEPRLGSYFTQSETNSYLCNNAPEAPIFENTITRDPRFAWIAIVQSDCEGNGLWDAGWWNWSFRGGGFDWDRSEGRCAAGTPKFVQEYRAVYIDTIQIDCCFSTDEHIDKVYAWEFDPALIKPWTSYGPSTGSGTIDYQGGVAVPVLEQ